MSSNLLKTGSSSILLGKNKHKSFLPSKKGKMLKITKIDKRHNDLKYLDVIRTIPNYSKYYCIPDETTYLLKPSDQFYNSVKKMVQKENTKIFKGDLQCNYIDYAGDKDMHDTIQQIQKYDDLTLWSSYSFILKFTKKILQAIMFLHQNKLCHLDIKPENIMVNKIKRTFKIIDFGFTSLEPFQDFIKNPKGTPYYFPKQFTSQTITEWHPEIKANDMKIKDGKFPFQKNYLLVYKIDAYCFGRTLYMLNYCYQERKIYSCYNCEKKGREKLENIIQDLLENDVNKRITITECYQKYFI